MWAQRITCARLNSLDWIGFEEFGEYKIWLHMLRQKHSLSINVLHAVNKDTEYNTVLLTYT